MEFTISSASRASSSGVLRGFCTKGLGAELISVVPLASRSASLKMHIRVKNLLDTKVKSANKFQETYADALFMASFFMLNLGGGLLIRALPPAFPASLILELLAGADFCGRVVPIPFDESAGVEGTLDPTPASSPDVAARGILAAGLEKRNTDYKSKS